MRGRLFLLVVCAALAQRATAQVTTGPSGFSGRALVMPFENVNREAKIHWVTEGAAVLLTDRLRVLGNNTITREERLKAFERLGVPSRAVLSDATVIKIGQLVGATDVVMGSLVVEGEDLVVRVRGIRVDVGRLRPEIVERGPLVDLLGIFDRIGRTLGPASPPQPEPPFQAPPSLSAFEYYIKGLLAESAAGQVEFLEMALRLGRGYDPARVAMWQVRAGQGDHVEALRVILEVPETSPLYRRSRFLAAISQLQLKQYDAATGTLEALLARDQSAAVLNNLGVIQLRRAAAVQPGAATKYFARAAKADQDDADYHFNLGYADVLERDLQAGIAALQEAVRRNPADGDAHYVLGAALLATGAAAEGTREKELAHRLSSTYADWERAAGSNPVPRGLERLKEDLEVPRANRIDFALASAEQRDQRELAAFYLDHGRRLYEQENDTEAAVELRRSLYLSPYQAEAHLLLGRIYLRSNRLREAVDEFKISLWTQETAAGHLGLAEAYLQSNDEASAQAEAKRAMALDPQSSEAKRLLGRTPPRPEQR